MTQEDAMQKITPGELEAARQYYRESVGTWEARFTEDIKRFSDKAAIATAVGVYLAL